MDEYYYLIPVVSEHTYVNNQRLSDLYNEKFPMINDMKNKRNACNSEKEKKHYNKLNKLIEKICGVMKIPEYILVIKKGDRCFELVTDFDITTDDLDDFEKYEVKEERKIIEYYVNSDYKNKLFKLFKNYGLLKEKALIKKISGY